MIVSVGTDRIAVQTGVRLMITDPLGNCLSVAAQRGPDGELGMVMSNRPDPDHPDFAVVTAGLDILDRRALIAALLEGMD